MRITSLFLFALTPVTVLWPQQTTTQTAAPSQRKLAFLVQGTLEDILQDLPATFQPIVRTALLPRLNFASLNSGLAAELSNLPASSSASALRYVFDSSVGSYVPTSQSLGPILTERAETIGKDRIFLAITHQRFQFDHQDDLDLRNFESRFPIFIPAGTLLPVAIQAVGVATSSYSVVVNLTTAHFTYGLTRWLDASYAFPIITNSVAFQVSGSIGLTASQPLAPLISRSVQASSTGFGDGVARVKAKLFDRGGLALAFATDVRLPIGDELNLQGAGAFGVKPFLIASYSGSTVSPHINAGYQWNGESYLGSATGTEKANLPAQVFYSIGADIALSRRMTLAVDLLDQVVLHGPGVLVTTQTVGTEVFRTVDYTNRTRHELNGAGGFKVNLKSDLVLTGNLLFRLNTAGLRTRVVPMVGLSYVF